MPISNTSLFPLAVVQLELKSTTCVMFGKGSGLSSHTTQISVWDTAGMERCGTLNMTRSYFKDCHGIILVSNCNVTGSLHILGDWIAAAQKYSDHGDQLVISLWVVDYDAAEMALVQDFRREWHIPDNLVINVSIANGDGIIEGFNMVAEAVTASCRGNHTPAILTIPPAPKRSHCCP